MGFIIAFSLGFGTPEADEEKMESNYWRIMMGVPIIIATVQSFLLLTVFRYETPFYSLINKNNEEEAKTVLSKLNAIIVIKGRIYHEEDVPMMINYIREANKVSSQHEKAKV